MVNTTAEQDFRPRTQRLETLIQEIEHFADPAVQAHTRELVQALMDLHAAGLERTLVHIAQAGEPGNAIIEALARDELVGGLLLLYGLHPVDFETRVRQALEAVRPYLRSHGGNVELVEVRAGTVRLRMQGSCHSCPSSALTLKTSIEEAVYAKAPDVTSIEVEGAEHEPVGPVSAFVPVGELSVRNGRRHPAG
jgi:Fe-S cluster biogenesis protein NfuA